MSEFQPQLTETVATDQFEVSRRSTLLERYMPYITGVSVALAFAASRPAESLAQASESAHQSNLPQCDLNLLNNGQNINCRPSGMPDSCVPDWAPGQINQFHHDPKAMSVGDVAATRVVAAARSRNAHSAGAPHRKDKLVLSFSDIAGVQNNARHSANAVLFLGAAMGASRYRGLVEQAKFYDPSDEQRKIYRDRVNTEVNAALECGLDVELTPAVDKNNQTRSATFKFGRDLATMFKGRVNIYGSYNETNYQDSWMKDEPGQTRAQTTRILYDSWRRGVKSVTRKAKVRFGEFSSMLYPGVALIEAVKASKKPLITDECVTIHGYVLNGEIPPLRNNNLKPDSREIGVDGDHIYEQIIRRLFKQGRLKTPEGKMPGRCYNEFAMMSEGSGSRNVPEPQRAAHVARLITWFSGIEGVKEFNQFQIDRADGIWNSGLVNVFRQMMPTWYSIRQAVRENRRYIKKISPKSLLPKPKGTP